MLDIASTLAILRTMNTPNPKALGSLLADARRRLGLTLRELEAQVGVSNAYLSQLESGKVREPSPVMLHKLAEVLGLAYADLMEAAGYPVPGRPSAAGSTGLAARIGPTTDDEQEALVEYLQFLRSRPRKGGRP